MSEEANTETIGTLHLWTPFGHEAVGGVSHHGYVTMIDEWMRATRDNRHDVLAVWSADESASTAIHTEHLLRVEWEANE